MSKELEKNKNLEKELIKLYKLLARVKTLREESIQCFLLNEKSHQLKVNGLFPEGYDNFKQEINQDMLSLTKSLKQLTTRIKHVSVNSGE